MAIIGGVTVTGFIAPSTTGDTYAVIDPIYGIDGLRSVANSTQRNAIPSLRRRYGMLVFQQDTNVYYQLLQSPWVFTDSDWQALAFTTGSTSANEFVDYFSASGNGQTVFSNVLTMTPNDVTKTKFFINGVKYRYGNLYDYTISGGTSVIWTGPFNILTTDELNMIYF